MKITLFNDTSVDWPLHSASVWGVNREDCIDAQEAVVFEVPEGYDVFLKVWDGCVMVQTYKPLTNAEARQLAFDASEDIQRRAREAREREAHTEHLLDRGCHEDCTLCDVLRDWDS